MNAKPGLLLWTANAVHFLGAHVAEHFDLIKLWEAPDPEAALAARGPEAAATLTWKLDRAMLAHLPNLRLIVVPGAGYDGVDVAAARARGVRIANAGDTHAGVVADHALALTLAAIHRLPDMQAMTLDGRWKSGEAPPRRHAMSAQTFGIVGLGNIGLAIAERLVPFGGEIAWWGPREKPARWPRHASLIDLARWSTALIVAARGDAAGLIDEAVIDAVGPDGYVVNITRGSVIDEDALILALREGRLGGAALDVFREEPTDPARWRDVPNLVLTPHVGGVSHESLASLRKAALQNLMSLVDGGPLVNEILE